MRIAIFTLFLLGAASLNAQVIFINELMASNRTIIPDEFLEFDDWVEIYNSGNPIDLGGWYFTDNPLNLTKWQFPIDQPDVTTVPSGGYLLIWCDNMPEQGPLHTSFKLSADGESALLVAPDGVTIIDSIDFGEQQSDISYGRTCDGCSNWTYFNVPTPLETNMQIPVPTQVLFINEVMTNNTANPFWVDEYNEMDRWFEIYNPNPYQVNLAGYYVSISSNPLQYQFPNTDPVRSTIPAQGFRVIWADNQSSQGVTHTNFILPTGGGTITLTGPDQTTVNAYTYQSMPSNTSFGRSSDGGLGNTQFQFPTPRASNTLQVIVPEVLYVNELMARNATDTTDTAGDFEDWFEIYNPNEYEVDLAGYYISDNPDNPTKWRVPETSGDFAVIPPLGYKLFYADSDPLQNWNHTSFKLNGDVGEWLIVRGPDGFSITDQISWGPQLPDTSYGRLNDGEPEWVLFVETTPEYSNNGATVRVPEIDRPIAEIYPNPVYRGNTVRFNGRYRYMVFSSNGRLVSSGGQAEELQTSDLAPGMYIVVLDEFYRLKLLVQ